jgi:hypothetical protein
MEHHRPRPIRLEVGPTLAPRDPRSLRAGRAHRGPPRRRAGDDVRRFLPASHAGPLGRRLVVPRCALRLLLWHGAPVLAPSRRLARPLSRHPARLLGRGHARAPGRVDGRDRPPMALAPAAHHLRGASCRVRLPVLRGRDILALLRLLAGDRGRRPRRDGRPSGPGGRARVRRPRAGGRSHSSSRGDDRLAGGRGSSPRPWALERAPRVRGLPAGPRGARSPAIRADGGPEHVRLRADPGPQVRASHRHLSPSGDGPLPRREASRLAHQLRSIGVPAHGRDTIGPGVRLPDRVTAAGRRAAAVPPRLVERPVSDLGARR